MATSDTLPRAGKPRRGLLHRLGLRRDPTPADLQPLHNHTTSDPQPAQAAQAARDTLARLAAAEAHLADTPDTEPRRPYTEGLCHELDAVIAPGATVLPGVYVVTLSRLRGTGTRPAPLKATADSAGDLATTIAEHVQDHTGTQEPVEVTVDPSVRGGLIRYGGTAIGTFSYTTPTAKDR